MIGWFAKRLRGKRRSDKPVGMLADTAHITFDPYAEVVRDILSHLRDQGGGRPAGTSLFSVLTIAQMRLDQERLLNELSQSAPQYGLSLKEISRGEITALKL